MVGAEHTARAHAGLHEGSISVGAGGGSGPRRIRASSRRRAMTGGSRMNNSSLSTPGCYRSGLLGLSGSVRAVRAWMAMMFWRRRAIGRGVKTHNSNAKVVVSQRAGRAPETLISVYTGAIARFLVGNSPFKCLYVIQRAGSREAASGALVSRAPPAPYAAHWSCELGP
jgi:hypothetical protein